MAKSKLEDKPKRKIMYPSTLDKLSSCRLQWAWSRKYQTKHTAEPLAFGIAIHHALERYYGHGESPVKAFMDYAKTQSLEISVGSGSQQKRFEYENGTQYALGIAMMQNYEKRYKVEPFSVIETELEVARRVPVPPDGEQGKSVYSEYFVGSRLDALVQDDAGRYYVLEHKTFESYYPAALEQSHQFVIEAYVAAGWLKKPVAGVIYNGLRKKAVATATTRLFERHTISINSVMTQNVLRRIYWEMKTMDAPEFHVYPQPGVMKCNMCEFRGPCLEYSHGGDYEFMLKTLYSAREERDDTWQ